MLRRLILIGTIGALLGIAVIYFIPVSSTVIKLGFLGCVGVAWAGLLILLWKRKPARIVLLILPLGLIIPLSLPGREIATDELREDYVKRLSEYEGTIYFWGGESAKGIDCSGLPRKAFRDALLSYGLKHANGQAFRAFVEQWWLDASAKALGEGYRGYAAQLGIEGTIREMEYGPLVAGDLAITKSGIHVLAYAGDGKWIQADPGIGSVITLDGRKDDNGWFTTPVTLHRWQLLNHTNVQ